MKSSPSIEELNLFNPAFLAALFHRSSVGHFEETKAGQDIPLAYASVAVALSPELRRALPTSIRIGFISWIATEPGFSIRFATVLQAVMEPLRQGFLLALQSHILELNGAAVRPAGKLALPTGLSDDTLKLFESSRFASRWFARAGSASTVLSLLGFTS
jgi:Family of unknown function (DUF6521)